ncbi:DHHC zinc finger domain-containing protein [Cardiosporidium cionae]|uniref:Palmitoyltransferase n=1 Tax=Cardiosporidium cionae TaxID=476202 RepID=A0ABQ7JD52_9APIC|nr:DHHC zinc finger domain-containing protein [Cardiosporidium cionae]|eukprot:KAF8821919.1 DHHC zinc finger domain-containing protein [Cardiosporidium cionae]
MRYFRQKRKAMEMSHHLPSAPEFVSEKWIRTIWIGRLYILSVSKYKTVIIVGPHWCFTIIMLALMLGVSIGFYATIGQAVTWYHLFLTSLLSCIAVGSFLGCSFKDPGIIHSKFTVTYPFASRKEKYEIFEKSYPDEALEVINYPKESKDSDVESLFSDLSLDSDTSDGDPLAQRMAPRSSMLLTSSNDEAICGLPSSIQADTTAAALEAGISKNKTIEENRVSPLYFFEGRPSRRGSRYPQIEKFCPSCQMWSPPSTIHCGECNVCIEGQDHHCPWISKCVGERTMLLFRTWVITSSVALLYFVIGSTVAGLSLHLSL